MNNEKKTKKILEDELKTTNEYLKKYTTPSSNSGIDIIAEAMKKGKVKSGSRFYKDDDEFSGVDLSYFTSEGKEVIVYCPESKEVLQGQSTAAEFLIKNESQNKIEAENTGNSDKFNDNQGPIEKH